MKTIRDVCKFIGKKVPTFAVCVETGCSYINPPGNEVHTTTNNLAEFVAKPNKGRLISFDIDPEHIAFAKEFTKHLEMMGSELLFICGDSVEMMHKEFDFLHDIEKDLPNHSDGKPFLIDVLCLDSKEFDEDHMVNEYNAVKSFLRPEKHFVLVDDIHNPNSVKYKKMVPILKELGYQYKEINTPTGLFLAAKGYDI